MPELTVAGEATPMPKRLYCWRCKTEYPMLYKNEARYVFGLEQGEEILKRYFQVTGLHETNAASVYHHIIEQHGPPCAKCKKPLRTPRATWCAACGACTCSTNDVCGHQC
jgi:hypothetical protein